ncbi:hypothetical protein [Halobacillus sp. Marseille-Q1614]|uniref:hypothetical protein n=1 Tax=Halobacillus sp. Marseille-Q1614 TaxID=2709134 RepID=UPI001571168C|nr:hypothetical protein [Halobacillus sp. Marseille-Q1614]
MKKLYTFPRNEKGFIFPWFLIASFIMIMITVFTAHQYKNQILSTESLTNYSQLQNLFTYAQSRFLQSEEWAEFPVTASYQLPNGFAMVGCETLSNETVECAYDLELDNGKSKKITKIYPTPN